MDAKFGLEHKKNHQPGPAPERHPTDPLSSLGNLGGWYLNLSARPGQPGDGDGRKVVKRCRFL